MCYHCHTLGNNPAAPPHRGTGCRDPRNTYFKRRPASAAAQRPSPPALPPVCAQCGARPRNKKGDGTYHPYCGKTCAAAAAGAPVSRPPLCTRCGNRQRWQKPDGNFHPYCGKTCAASASGRATPRRPQSARPPNTLDGYHGTDPDAARSIIANGFRPSPGGMLGAGVYWSDQESKARNYGTAILRLRVRPGKVKRIDRQGHPQQTSWSQAYDTAWVPAGCGMVPSGLSENCTKDPGRISVVAVSFDGGTRWQAVSNGAIS